VADIPANVDAKVTSDGSWAGLSWSGLSEHHSAGGDDPCTLPDHSHNWSHGHVVNQTGEETFLGQISVVSFHMFLSWSAQFHCDQLETFLFKSLGDLTDKSSLDTVWLDHDESSLVFAHFEDKLFGYVEYRLNIIDIKNMGSKFNSEILPLSPGENSQESIGLTAH
jgi:hypothetical protein